MSQSRLEWKVGVFVLVGLILLAALLLQFSKGASLFRSSYNIILQAQNVPGLKPRADVLMSGVKIGSVSEITLAPDGKSVNITLTIYSQFKIHQDARFTIEQSGFLGDQYVSVSPTQNQAPPYEDGGVAKADTPFNLQEVARSANELVLRVQDTANTVNQMLNEMREFLLNPSTLTNISITVSNMRTVSDQAVATMQNLDGLLQTNGPAVSLSTSNLALFSANINRTAESLNSLLATNQGKINSAISNVDASTASLRSLMADVEAGKGLAGNLIKNEELSESVSQIAHNLSITSSNLNRLGLWGILWKRKDPGSPEAPAERLTSPKDTRKK